jgi:hypothetical protein
MARGGAMVGMPDRRALSVWVLTPTSSATGDTGYQPKAVFSMAQVAAAWIASQRATCMLTEYPVDISVYEWATGRGYFTPTRDDQRASAFIETFSDASQAHCHFEDGQPLYALDPRGVSMPDIEARLREVWIFNGSGRRRAFPSAVFSERTAAEAWIERIRASGTLHRLMLDSPADSSPAERVSYLLGLAIS